MEKPPEFPGMEFDFLRYMDVRPENQRQIQSFYLPYFESCQSVIDLACGDADFVALLHERDINVLGVDSDEKSYQAALKQNLPVIQADVFEYLHQQPDSSVDGVFSAHLVEHLPYPKVIELIEQSFRILRPGGRIVLATPNVRSLFSHLEMFYLHYGHVTFYHPRLLCFFLDHCGFVESQFGENPTTASPMMPKVSEMLAQPMPRFQSKTAIPYHVSYSPVIPIQGNSLLSHVSYWVKRWWTRMFVQPFTDELVLNTNRILAQMADDSATWQQQINQSIEQVTDRVTTITEMLQSLNGAFETFTTATKPLIPTQAK